MIVIMILLILILVTIIIGLLTSMVNNSHNCNHLWESFNTSSVKCKKCNKVIFSYPLNKENETELSELESDLA
jgi:hypothetical protein